MMRILPPIESMRSTKPLKWMVFFSPANSISMSACNSASKYSIKTGSVCSLRNFFSCFKMRSINSIAILKLRRFFPVLYADLSWLKCSKNSFSILYSYSFSILSMSKEVIFGGGVDFSVLSLLYRAKGMYNSSKTLWMNVPKVLLSTSSSIVSSSPNSNTFR